MYFVIYVMGPICGVESSEAGKSEGGEVAIGLEVK